MGGGWGRVCWDVDEIGDGMAVPTMGTKVMISNMRHERKRKPESTILAVELLRWMRSLVKELRGRQRLNE